MTERAHAAAWRASIGTLLGTPVADPTRGAFDYDDVPETLPRIYALVTVSRRFGGEPRNSGKRSMRGWRLTTRAVGTTVDEARWARDRIALLIEKRNTTIGSTLLEFESETPIEQDGDGRWSGLTVWTYATNS